MLHVTVVQYEKGDRQTQMCRKNRLSEKSKNQYIDLEVMYQGLLMYTY